MKVTNKILDKQLVETLLQEFGSPLYVYDEQTIRSQFQQLKSGFQDIPLQIHYAMKANPNPAILKIILDEGAYIDAVSPFEVRLALETGFAPSHIFFTGNNIIKEDLEYCLKEGVSINIDSLSWLERYGQINPGGEVSVRINPGVGAGHHAHCITGGPQSKFGIYYDQIDQIQAIVEKYHLNLVGIHSHIGTGILEPDPMLAAMEMVLSVAKQFSGLKFVDFGGGFGIPYRPNQEPLDMTALGKQMSDYFKDFCQDYGKTLEMKIEPGRYLVASAGTFLATVNTVKNTPKYRFIGVDSGFNHLIRPTLYGSYHHVYNASRPEGEQENAVIVGNICETGDIFTRTSDGKMERSIVKVEEGDRIAICDVGAYGIVMSSQYNMRPRPAEVLISNGSFRLIRKRETFEDLISSYM